MHCLSSIERTTWRRQTAVALVGPPTSVKRNAVWNVKLTILFGRRSSRTTSSSSIQNVLPVVFRFWHAQFKNWSNTNGCTERDVAGQTRLHKRTRMRANVLNSEIVRLSFWQYCCCSSTEAKGTSGHQQLRLRFVGWSGQWKVWDLKSSISSGTRLCRMRSSFWNRNVLSVVFRFWHAQLKNWSNTKSCTEHRPSNAAA
jgi:hypothetical protein